MTWQYLAGFFDGEGCLSIGRQHPKLNGTFLAQIGQSGREGKALLDEIQNFLGENGIKSQVQKKKTTEMRDGWKKYKRKEFWSLSIRSRKHVVGFIRGVFPWLRIKKAHAQDILRYLSCFPSIQGMGAMNWFNRETILKAREAGMGYKRIAKEFGLPESSVRYKIYPKAKKSQMLMWN